MTDALGLIASVNGLQSRSRRNNCVTRSLSKVLSRRGGGSVRWGLAPKDEIKFLPNRYRDMLRGTEPEFLAEAFV
jgi:hypothetical protein